MWEINQPGTLRGLEILLILFALKVDESREQQDHVTSLVHDGCPAICAANLARQFVPARLFAAVIPAKVVMATSEVDILFVEDGSPLKRRA